MSDNPQYGSKAVIALPRIRTLGLSGGDAVAFAQAQFMNDVSALAPGAWQWNGWLDPKGRVQALFALLRRDADTLWLVTPSDIDALAAALRRYVFRSKVAIREIAVHASGRHVRPDIARGAVAAFGPDGEVELDLSGDAGARTLRLSPDPAIGTADDAAWWALDVAHGWPGIPGAALEAFTPQQLSLQRLSAFSVKKGCYPGQEIVARTHFLGRAKRALVRFDTVDAPPGTAVQDADGRDVGHVVCVAGRSALAVVPLDAPGGTLRIGRDVLASVPLADGLSR